MNPVFILSDIDINSVIKNPLNNNYGFFDVTKSDIDIVAQYLSFRSNIFSINNYNIEIFNDEVVFIYIRDLSNDYNRYNKELIQLINNATFSNDVKSIFFIDVWDDLSSNINTEIKNKITESSSNFLSKISSKVFFLLLAKDNKESKEVTIDDIYCQINCLITILNNNYSEIYPYFKANENFKANKNFNINSFGSSAILHPKRYIEPAIFHLNNASQLYSLLTNKAFNKDEFYNVSALISSLNDEKIDSLLNNKYSNSPDMVNVLGSVNTLYDKCDIDSVGNTFDSIELFPFSSFVSDNDKLSTSSIFSGHNDYLLDVNNRTTDAKKETKKFLNNANTLFKNYRNDKIISIQGDLNRQKKNKAEKIKGYISEYSDNFIKTTDGDLSSNFGDTSSFEAFVEVLSYFAVDSENDKFDHDKNLNKKIENISKESPIERVLFRRKLFKTFYDKNSQLKKNIEDIDNELENKNGDSGFRKLIEQKKQLSFNLIDKDLIFFKKQRYSFLQITTVFSVFTSLILLLLLNSIPTIALIPIVIGVILIIIKAIEYKKYRKYLEYKISQKVNLLNDVIKSHDSFIKDYISQIKIEYTLEVIKEIQNYCKVKIYKIKNFRRYLINHYIYSITEYDTLNFGNSTFEYSLITKKDFENLFFNFSQVSYFKKNPSKKLTFLNLYIDKSKTDKVYEFSLNSLDIKFFDENEIANDIVEALDEHKSETTYHNEFDKEPVLYLSDNNNSEPIILEDINQGQIGNCYFMASIGAIANTRPSYLRKIITLFDQSNDVTEDDESSNKQSFLVRFFDEDRNVKYVAIDNKFWFYTDSIKPVYANFGNVTKNNYEIWAMVLEKAWAKVNGGYTKTIGSNRNSSFNKQQRKLDFGFALSGNFIDYKSISDYSQDSPIIKLLENRLKDNSPIVVYSKYKPEDNEVVDSHAYTVKNIDNDKIHIYNPHGNNHLFDISIGFFRANFDTMLFFNLEEAAEFVIPPKEKVKYIDHIDEIEKDLYSFFSDKLSAEIQDMPISEKKHKKIMKRIDKSSIPLFNEINIDEEYSILFTDNNIPCKNIFKNTPNDVQPIFDKDINLLLIKIMQWELK